MDFGTRRLKCVLCPQVNETSLAALCSSCADILGPEYTLKIPLSPEDDSDVYEPLSYGFLASWAHPTPTKPITVAITAIHNDKESTERYEKVRSANHSSAETRLFHRTRVDCSFGQNFVPPCESKQCHLCRISKDGFRHPIPSDVRPFNNGVWDRFGPAIYATPISSKAADYENQRNFSSNNNETRTRHIIVARVATGNMEMMYRGDSSRSAASPGYDSICAPGGSAVNYTEHAVYKDGGALPIFVISFQGGF
ncbi:unnamed protein product [Tilletia controversa]|uniref:PARP catalytic domain-containing protein n=3 Tax=Tilletia TaxID=13289 RepID=A0A8X7T0N8_9BASI|nr:hypothetical protein CF336_g138 [Tilletia laevis]KAE8206111.1 hypothetical protein CF328_g119 [Tilletia controversa]KAE8265683.1 hypothetical protein A4X03_0g93 [Tilletia caries]KAE8255800.1 hypothetical protein A4X06_0g252 [Tilletia controversa]CAD6899896.1 unnamed protein product [Tilletia caries]